MEKKHKQLLIERNIEKSLESIDDARFLLDHNKLHLAANRIYYSFYYIMSALSIQNNFQSSKHKQLIGWFNKNFIKERIFPNHVGNTLLSAYQKRTDADYSVYIQFEKDDVEDLYIKGLDSITIVKDYIISNNQ